MTKLSQSSAVANLSSMTSIAGSETPARLYEPGCLACSDPKNCLIPSSGKSELEKREAVMSKSKFFSRSLFWAASTTRYVAPIPSSLRPAM